MQIADFTPSPGDSCTSRVSLRSPGYPLPQPWTSQEAGQRAPGSPSKLALSSAARGEDASIAGQTGRLMSERGGLVAWLQAHTAANFQEAAPGGLRFGAQEGAAKACFLSQPQVSVKADVFPILDSNLFNFSVL